MEIGGSVGCKIGTEAVNLADEQRTTAERSVEAIHSTIVQKTIDLVALFG